MYSFLFICNHGDLRPLELSMAITGRVMPSLRHATRCSWRPLLEIGGGWFYYAPDPLPATTLMTEEINDTLAVLVYGEVYGVASAARRISDEWQAGGLAAIRALDGSFSAVIVDRLEKTVHVASDVFGRRTLRWFAQDGLLLLSPHDVPIVATGLCPLEYDLVAASSILAVEWSLGGRSVLKAIKPCDPRKVLRWDAGLQEFDDAPIGGNGRLGEGDHAGCAELREQMVEAMLRHAQDLTERSDRIRVELTAGLDSRASFAALSAVLKDRLEVQTDGEADDVDVRVARRIARKYGVPHDSSAPALPTVEAFLANTGNYAFFYNGDANAKRALAPPTVYDRFAPIRIGGGAGEIYRGYYYPQGESALSKDEALEILLKKCAKVQRYSWRAGELGEGVRCRLAAAVEPLAAISEDGYDVLDLFYLYERYGRWSLGARSPQGGRYFLYESVPVLRLAFRMPAPIGHHCRLHEALIRRFLPGVYWWPINGRSILPLQRVLPESGKLVAQLLRAASRVRWPAARLQAKSHEQVRAELLATLLQGDLRDRLTYRDSLGEQILGRDGLSKMIEDHVSGKANRLEPLGSLFTLEVWKDQIQDAAAQARRAAALTP